MAPGRSHRAASAAHKNLAEPGGEESWDDSDEEAQPKAARAGVKRKAPKAATTVAEGQPQPAKQRRIKQAVDVHDLTLLEIIVSHSGSMDTAVKEWIERYKVNRAAAAAELVTLLVKACGADDELSEEDVEGGEVDSIAQRLTQLVQEEGGVTLFTPTRQGRLVSQHYCLFWGKVLRALAASDLLFDDFELNDKLTRLVTALNISVVRPFRHAATLTAAQLVSSWITASKGLADSRNLAQAQLDAEERKKGKAHNQGMINSWRRTLERTHARVEDLRNFRSVIFSGVFSHRFRDVSDEIRAIVIEAIGSWVVALPSEFLSDSYLKYLAWALSDRAPLVRLAAVKALKELYNNSDNVPRLHDFTNRFTPRFCELMHDVDEEVAAAGLQLLALLVEHGIISHKDVSGVYMLLAMPHAELRAAAAALVVNLLEEQGKEAVTAAEERLRAAIAAAAPQAPPTKGAKGRGSKAKAAQQQATGGASALEAAAAAAHTMLEEPSKLKLAGLLAVMGKLASAEPLDGNTSSQGLSQPSTQQQQGSDASSSAAPTLPQTVVTKLVDALWEHMYAVLSDISGLTSALSDDSAVELWGKVGTAHLASLTAEAVRMHIFGGGARAAAGRKGRLGRGRAAAAAAAEGVTADDDAQQEVTVLMMQQLPQLLKLYQAEPLVVAPLLTLPRMLRLDLYLLRGAAEQYRALLTQVDGLLQHHQQQQLLVEAAGALVYASKAGPEALQEVGRQVLSTTCATAAGKLAAAATAVSKLSATQLSEGVADLVESPEDAPDALLSLLAGARRVHVLLAAGSRSLAQEATLTKTCQGLLKACIEGRELGPEITSVLVHISTLRLMWQLAAATAAAAAGGGAGLDRAAATAYVQQRSAFVKVLDFLLEHGAGELLVTPEQLLARHSWTAGRHLGRNTNSQVPAELAEQLSVGLLSLQDLAFMQLTELMFLENGNVAAAEQAAAAAAGGGRRAAAAAAGGFGHMELSSTVLQKMWQYSREVLEREAPEVLPAGEEGEEDDVIDDPDDVFDEFDAEGAAASRAARAALRRDALSAAASSLESIKQQVVAALARLLAYKVLPEPGFSWLLSRMITLLDGYGPQASAATRSLLVHLKSHSQDGGLVTHLVEGLTLLYDDAQELHGSEDAVAAAGHTRGDRSDVSSWAHVAAVSTKLAGIFQGHNLSQLVLGSLFDKGLAWTLDEPLGRSAFPLVCLGPFLSKLSPSEAERVAGALSQRVEEVGLQEEDEERQQLEAFLGHLQERAAGKKVTRGVLKTPGRAAAAAEAEAADDADEAAAEGAEGAAAAAGKSTGKAGQRKGSRIRFAVEGDEDDQQQQAKSPAAAAGRRGGRGAAKQTAADADGWVSKHRDSSSGSPGVGGRRAGAQQQQRTRQQPRRQQQQPEYDEEQQEEEDAVEDEEQQEEEPQQQHQRRGRRGAAAAAPAVHSQSQSQGRRRNSQQQSGSAAAAGSEACGDSVGSLQAQSEDGAPAFFSVEELPAVGRRRPQQQQQQQQGRGSAATRRAAAAAAEEDEDMFEADDEQQKGSDGFAAAGGFGGSLRADSGDSEDGYGSEDEPMTMGSLPSLNVVIDDMPDDDGIEVDEPPPTRRFGRRR